MRVYREQEGWILHIQPYQDNKSLVQVLTPDEGRIKLVMYKHKHEPLLTLNRYQFQFYGQQALKTCKRYESLGEFFPLKGKPLFCILYVNELIIRLVPLDQPLEGLLDAYEWLLNAFGQGFDLEASLRQFELWLLEALGYGIALMTDAHTQKAIEADKFYGFQVNEGIFELDPLYQSKGIPGTHLMDIATGQFKHPRSLEYAKWLTRQTLGYLLGDKPLASRAFFERLTLD